MRLAADVHVLPIPRDAEDRAGQLNLTLILDEANGPTLVDTGFPDQAEDIGANLEEIGVGVEDLRRIILTHQDLDHVGSASDLVRGSDARVLAHSVAAPYIDGTLNPLKPTEKMLRERPQMGELLERLETVSVDEHLEDGTRLDVAGGLRVVFTPGHTPDHVSLYLEDRKILIAGDALTAADGRLHGPPPPPLTLDVRTAAESVKKLAALDVEAIVCYHGGLVTEDPNGQLERVARESS